MRKPNTFAGVNLDKLAAEDEFMRDYLHDFIHDADYSNLNLDGLTPDEIYQTGKDYRDAAHYKKTDLELAKKYFQAAADKGCAAAFYDLGVMYYTDFIPNYEKAFELFKKAAAAGNAEAMCSLGAMYEYGAGTRQNMKKSLKWYEAAADAGSALAWELLGHKAYFGREEFFCGSGQYERAFACYQKGADLGGAGAMFALARMYRAGEAAARDYGKAAEWFEKSAALGNGHALDALCSMYDDGEISGRAYKTAAEWFLACACNGDAAVELALSFRALDDSGGSIVDYGKAVYWYEQAAAKGSLKAFDELIELYSRGGKHKEETTIPIDIEKAAFWVKKAAETGDPAAMYRCSLWLDPAEGMPDGLPRDKAASLAWAEKAAAAGNADAMNDIARRYNYGRDGLFKDIKLARYWYTEAAARGCDSAKSSIKIIDEDARPPKEHPSRDDTLDIAKILKKRFPETEASGLSGAQIVCMLKEAGLGYLLEEPRAEIDETYLDKIKYEWTFAGRHSGNDNEEGPLLDTEVEHS